MYVMAKPLRTLAYEWKKESIDLRTRYGEEKTARTLETLAADLLKHLEKAQGRRFNLQDASRHSGYSADHLGRLVRSGEIPNAGRTNAPQIALRDLPMKPGHLPSGVDRDEVTEARAATIARSIVSPEKEANDG